MSPASALQRRALSVSGKLLRFPPTLLFKTHKLEFGTRGSEAQILPLRQIFPSTCRVAAWFLPLQFKIYKINYMPSNTRLHEPQIPIVDRDHRSP